MLTRSLLRSLKHNEAYRLISSSSTPLGNWCATRFYTCFYTLIQRYSEEARTNQSHGDQEHHDSEYVRSASGEACCLEQMGTYRRSRVCFGVMPRLDTCTLTWGSASAECPVRREREGEGRMVGEEERTITEEATGSDSTCSSLKECRVGVSESSAELMRGGLLTRSAGEPPEGS